MYHYVCSLKRFSMCACAVCRCVGVPRSKAGIQVFLSPSPLLATGALGPTGAHSQQEPPGTGITRLAFYRTL